MSIRAVPLPMMPRINTAMAAASESKSHHADHRWKCVDFGSFSCRRGYWNIAGLGCGTGFFVKTGTNNDGIHDGPPDAGVPPIRDHRPTARRERRTQEFHNIVIERVAVVNTPAYHFHFSNAGHVAVSGCALESRGLSTDGLHFDGPSNDIRMSDCEFANGDDSIALNCPKGYYGNISRVAVSTCSFNSLSACRGENRKGWNMHPAPGIGLLQTTKVTFDCMSATFRVNSDKELSLVCLQAREPGT